MLIPKRVKYRRQHRPNRRGVSKGGNLSLIHISEPTRRS